MTYTACSIAEFTKLVQPLVGLNVARPWQGYGSALFLELGQLSTIKWKRQYLAKGEACISVEWDWRIENGGAVLYGSSNSRPEIERRIDSLENTTIQSLSVVGQIPELVVAFSNGHYLRSMVMVTGDPKWSIKVQDGCWVHAEAGALLVGDGAYAHGTTEEEDRAFALAEGTAARWGTPLAEPAGGPCRQCACFVPIDGDGRLLDYGACISSSSPFDGRIVKCTSGCPAFVVDEET